MSSFKYGKPFVKLYLINIQSNPDMTLLSFRQNLCRYVEGGCKTKYCIIGNFSYGIVLAITKGGAISVSECSLTQ